MSEQTPEEIRAETSLELDRLLLKVLKEGQVVVDETTGQPKTITPSAAMLNMIRGRLKDLNVGGLAIPGTPTSDLLTKAEQRFGTLRIADVDDSEDAATRVAV